MPLHHGRMPRQVGPLALGLVVLALSGAAPAPSSEHGPAAAPGPIAVKRQEYGRGLRSYWLFEPAGPAAPEVAPVVAFHHGWLAYNPGAYGAWIDHLVRRGMVVIFPRYQADWTTPPAEFLPNALAAVRDAFDVLGAAPGHVRPDRDRFALIGHSAGGNLSAQMAAVAAEHHLPAPRAVLALMPGEVKALREPGLDGIPAATLLVIVAAEHDRIVGDHRARQIYAEAAAIPPSRKKYVLYRTDRHGFPHLVADHFAPTAALARFDTGEGPFRALQMTQAELNAFDRLGFWRLADLTLDAAFAGRTLDEAIGDGAALRDLGRWSDGTAVAPPIVGDDPAEVPRVLPANGLRLFPWVASGSPRTLTR